LEYSPSPHIHGKSGIPTTLISPSITVVGTAFTPYFFIFDLITSVIEKESRKGFTGSGPPLGQSEWRSFGLFRAADEAELREVLDSLPLHPNDPEYRACQDAYQHIICESSLSCFPDTPYREYNETLFFLAAVLTRTDISSSILRDSLYHLLLCLNKCVDALFFII
jgi:hypothetical protein